jgi:hypothetical protein
MVEHPPSEPSEPSKGEALTSSSSTTKKKIKKNVSF